MTGCPRCAVLSAVLVLGIACTGTGRAGEKPPVLPKTDESRATHYALADFIRKSPDNTVGSWRELKFGIVDSEADGCTVRRVLTDLGVASANITEVDPSRPLTQFDVLLLADGVVGRVGAIVGGATRIQEFVNNGGICWILSQHHDTWSCQWLPERLKSPKLTHQYGMRCVGRKAPHYLCPWLVKRHHAVFNHPNHLDESDFSFWTLTVDDNPCFTTAFSALTSVSGWDVLGRYADPDCADGALILQSPDGEGLYFWTQIFSPQIVWDQPNERPRRTWEKLLDNVLTYFVSLRRGQVCQIESRPRPWSVLAGEPLVIEATVESPMAIERAVAEVRDPEGKLAEVTLDMAGDGRLKGTFTPRKGGQYFARVAVRFHDGAEAHDHFFFKVTNGWTAYRSIAHVHLRDCNGYGTQCAGALFGAARHLGYDVIQLAPLKDEGRWDEARAADDPACRFVPGCELHYRIYERSGERGEHCFEDVRAVGIPAFIPYPHRFYEDEARRIVGELVERIHAQGGLVHGNSGAYWAARGLPIDGIEIDLSLGLDWGKPQAEYAWAKGVRPVDMVEVAPRLGPFWAKRQPIWTVGAIDCHGIITLLTRRCWNVVWLDKPLTIPNYLAALRAGRFAASCKIDTVWLDVAGQPMGGTVYAVDDVPVHYRVDAGQPARDIGAVRWPSKTPELGRLGDLEFHDQRFFEPDEQAYVIPPESPRTIRQVDVFRNERVVNSVTPDARRVEDGLSIRVGDDDSYYLYLRVRSSDGCAYTNPIFVRKVDGPPGAWLWTRGEIARVDCDRQANRWRIQLSHGGNLRFHLPGETVSCVVDGERLTCRLDQPGGIGELKVPDEEKVIEISW